jgi:hypothetical protein
MKHVKAPASETLADETSRPGEHELLPGEIPGTATFSIQMRSGEHRDGSVNVERQVIYFLIRGKAAVTTEGKELSLEDMTLFVPCPGEAVTLVSLTNTHWLAIRMDLRPEESEHLPRHLYPMTRRYQECEKYRDYFKSEKTVSRTLVEPFSLPRFCMGSVETTGPDRIEPHAHPMLDQLFNSFPENDCTLLVDGASFRYGGNCLLHIPLGSDHGVQADTGDVVHYLWIDFFEKAEEMQYLVEVHKPVED